ncbi:MAG: ComEC/Rec2 family competence protein [Minisyncoccales bacterium]
MNSRNKKFVWAILTGLLIFNFLAWSVIYHLNKPHSLEVVFFDVGQGNAALIKSTNGHYILIDSGPNASILEKLAKEIPFWQKKIDLVIITHAHKDHFAGLADVMERYRVENIIWNGARENSLDFQRWQDLISQTKSNIKIGWAGQRIKSKDFSLDILYPFFNLIDIEFKDANFSSFVLRLTYKEHSFLFMGDTYQSIEEELVSKEKFCQKEMNQENLDYLCQKMHLNSDVLLVGHHGSKTSTSEQFVQAVSPQVAIISVGQNNKFGQPAQEVLDRLAKYDIRVLRTDLNGDIKIISDGKRLLISN